MYNGDCCTVLPSLPDESIGFSVYSPPFADLFVYSDEQSDMGNARSYEEFFEHYSFLVSELYRVLMPGRIVAVHAMDLPTFASKGEEIGLKEFPDDIIKCHKKAGFVFHSRHCIWKDPLIAATRTHALGLAHKQIVKDSCVCRMGVADYVVAFRKPGENPKPVCNENGLTRYIGERGVPKDLNRYINWPDPKTNKRSHWIWQQYASPVWDDISQTKVLPYRGGKEADDGRHLCPLQLQVIERCLTLWSAPDDRVLTPFAGVGSEVYSAVKMGRKGIGIELKKSYFRQMLRNLESLATVQKNKAEFSV